MGFILLLPSLFTEVVYGKGAPNMDPILKGSLVDLYKILAITGYHFKEYKVVQPFRYSFSFFPVLKLLPNQSLQCWPKAEFISFKPMLKNLKPLHIKFPATNVVIFKISKSQMDLNNLKPVENSFSSFQVIFLYFLYINRSGDNLQQEDRELVS